MYMNGAATAISPEIKNAIEDELQLYALQLAA
jgi:hypothetical protein